MQWETKHFDACKMMMAARWGCQVAADVPNAGQDTWSDLKANKYAESCNTGLDGEKGYRITQSGRDAYRLAMARTRKR